MIKCSATQVPMCTSCETRKFEVGGKKNDAFLIFHNNVFVEVSLTNTNVLPPALHKQDDKSSS